MPDDLGRQYIIVNIAGFELRRVADGEIKEKMAVVVGKPYSRTPVFSDAIRYPSSSTPTGTCRPGLPPRKNCPSCRATRRQ